MFKLGLLATVALFLAVTQAIPYPKTDLATATVDSSEESDETKEMMQEISEMCRNNSGSDEAFANLTKAIPTGLECVLGAVDLDGLTNEIDALTNETRSVFFPRYCPQLRTGSACINGILRAARPCLEEDDYNIVHALTGILPDAIELICKNDGELLFMLEEPKYRECVENVSENAMECIVPFAIEADEWDLSHLTQSQCGTLSELRKCVQSKLDVCKTPNLISVYDLFHNALFRMTPCRNYVETSKVTMVDNNTINEV